MCKLDKQFRFIMRRLTADCARPFAQFSSTLLNVLGCIHVRRAARTTGGT